MKSLILALSLLALSVPASDAFSLPLRPGIGQGQQGPLARLQNVRQKVQNIRARIQERRAARAAAQQAAAANAGQASGVPAAAQ